MIAGWTLIRKTSLLHKIGPMARRSSFANKIILQPASSCDETGAENDLEIVMDPHKLLCTIQLGSISSSRCQKSRMLLHPEWSMRNPRIFADFCLFTTSVVRLRSFELRRGSPRSQLACRAAAPEERRLVEPDGIEPTTSCLQSTRSPS
jgi:hypothetical protein